MLNYHQYYWLNIMIKRAIKVAIFWTLALYVVIAVGFGFGHSSQMTSSSDGDPTVTMDGVQAALSWPWYVVQVVNRLS